MFKKYIPFACAKSIYDIDTDFYVRNNVKVLLMDLDNTLDSYKLFHPTEKARKLMEKLIEVGIKPVIVSNNKGLRVSTYAKDLNVTYFNSVGKPFAFKLNKIIKSNGWNKSEMMLVGDQMVTDVRAGQRAKIRVVLTEKIVPEDQWTTRINRILGKRIRKYHQKRNNLIDWRLK